MLSPELEETLQKALLFAAERGHEFATLEHLLLAIMDDADCVPLFRKYCRKAPEVRSGTRMNDSPARAETGKFFRRVSG